MFGCLILLAQFFFFFRCFLLTFGLDWEGTLYIPVSSTWYTPKIVKNTLLHTICSTHFSVFVNVAKHGLSYLIHISLPKFSVDYFAWISFQTCYICEERGRESKTAHGACMNCNKTGCRHAFHVTWWVILFKSCIIM